MAQIAVYYPTTSLWLGDAQSDASTLTLMQELLEHQRDFDFVDEQALSSLLALEKGTLRSLSGNEYRAVLVPDAVVISRASLERLRVFVKSGGRVVFLGRTPARVTDPTFLKAAAPGDLSWAIHEPKLEITPAVLAALPARDVQLDRAASAVRCVHRRWRDADAYFFFNEGDHREAFTITVSGRGRAQVWDTASGSITEVLNGTATKDAWRGPMTLEPHATTFLVIGAWPLPKP